MDYICSQRWRSSIQSAKTRPGADCGSDHELLIAKVKVKLFNHVRLFVTPWTVAYQAPPSILHPWDFAVKNTEVGFHFLIAKIRLKLTKVGKTTRPFSSVQSLSHVRLFVTPWTIARQASLSITNSPSLTKLMSVE